MADLNETILATNNASQSQIDLDLIFAQQSHITNINEFLSEQDSRKALRYWIDEFIPKNQLNDADSIIRNIYQTIANIDELINEQLNIIIHEPRFQKLEAAWRGVWFLVCQADGAQHLKIKVLDLSWNELTRDISRAMEFDQSLLFQKVYNEEFGQPGGEPYGVLIGDYEISHKPSKKHPHDDIATLAGVSEVAAASFCPFIAAASCEMFGLDDNTELGLPLNFVETFHLQEYIKWNALREKPDSRFIGLTTPKILMRVPYRTKPGSYKGIFFYEKVSAKKQQNYLWGNAAYAFGSILIREFINIGWFGHIRGVPRSMVAGGLLTTLPVDYFATDAADIAYKPVTDVIITDSTEKHLSELGFIPLCQCYLSPLAAFYNNQSIQLPQVHNTKYATVNDKLSTMLQHILCASRMAHYIKIIMRDKVGSFHSASDCEDYLRDWLYEYSTGREDLNWEDQARYPLKNGSVSVKEHPGKPGHYYCTILLQPHYQLDQMVSELELTTELAPLSR